jgi:hypothetical protein
VPTLVEGYPEAEQRKVLAALLRGKSGLDFKSPLYARTVCEQLNAVPPTVARAIDLVHQAVSGDAAARGPHDL